MGDFERLKDMKPEEVRAYLDTLSFEERMRLTERLAQSLHSQMLVNSDIIEQKAEDLLHPNYEEIAKREIDRIRRM